MTSGRVRAVAQHLAQALVEGAPAGVAVRLVAQHPGPHRRRHHARHRADAAPVVARASASIGVPSSSRPAASWRCGRLGGVGVGLEQHRADQRTAHRPARPRPSRSAGRRGRTGPGSSPTTSPAGRTSTRDAPAASIRATASALAAVRRGSAKTRASSSSVPGGGGRQSTGPVRAACVGQRVGQPRRRRPSPPIGSPLSSPVTARHGVRRAMPRRRRAGRRRRWTA